MATIEAWGAPVRTMPRSKSCSPRVAFSDVVLLEGLIAMSS